MHEPLALPDCERISSHVRCEELDFRCLASAIDFMTTPLTTHTYAREKSFGVEQTSIAHRDGMTLLAGVASAHHVFPLELVLVACNN